MLDRARAISLWGWRRGAQSEPQVRLDRPIFLVGCAKSGTSLLGLIFSYHPKVGPKNRSRGDYEGLAEFSAALLEDAVHDRVAHEMEEKAVWDRYLPINGITLRMGKELILKESGLSQQHKLMLVSRLAKRFREDRFFSKQPFNTFRVHVLRELFPDAKIVAIHRDGRDVVRSWGRSHDRWRELGGYEKAIRILARKWNEAVDHVEAHKEKLEIYTLRYEDLVGNTEQVLRSALAFCELEYPRALYRGLRLRDRRSLWETGIPKEFHSLLHEETGRNRSRLGY